MKNLLVGFLMFFGFSFAANAQVKPIENVVIETPTVQCGMCKSKIEKMMARAEGVKAVKVDLKKKQTYITYITDRTNVSTLEAELANIGYDANKVTAEEGAYKKLPKCCKKPEDRE